MGFIGILGVRNLQSVCACGNVTDSDDSHVRRLETITIRLRQLSLQFNFLHISRNKRVCSSHCVPLRLRFIRVEISSQIAANPVKSACTFQCNVENKGNKKKEREERKILLTYPLAWRPIVKFARRAATRLLSVCLLSIYGRRLAKLREIVWRRACVCRVLRSFL